MKKTIGKANISVNKKVLPCKAAGSVNAPKSRRRTDYLKVICWMAVPIVIVALLVLDAVGVYTFNTERLLVLGVGLLIILLPFFSEITVKNLTVKRNKFKDKG